MANPVEDLPLLKDVQQEYGGVDHALRLIFDLLFVAGADVESIRSQLTKSPYPYAVAYDEIYKMTDSVLGASRAALRCGEVLIRAHFERTAKLARLLPSKKFDSLMRHWQERTTLLKWMNCLFMYPLRTSQNKDMESLLNRAFHDSFYDHFKEDVALEVAELIHGIRDGNPSIIATGSEFIVKALGFFELMGLGTQSAPIFTAYDEDFEPHFLRETREFYRKKATTWNDRNDTADFLVQVEKAYEMERGLVTRFLRPVTEAKIIEILDEELVEAYKSHFLNRDGSGCKGLLRCDFESTSVEDEQKRLQLKRMLDILKGLKNEGGLKIMATLFQEFIEERGDEVVRARTSQLQELTESSKGKKVADQVFFDALSALHEKFAAIIESLLESHPLFSKALQKAFKKIVNPNSSDQENSPTVIFANYCDGLLAKGSKEVNCEGEQEKMVKLFDYVHDKDVFEAVYRELLGKRLLSGRSGDDVLEKSMIRKLKLRCGAKFTDKLEQMLSDFAKSADHQTQFQKSLACSNVGFDLHDFSVRLLSPGVWPPSTRIDLALPPAMEECKRLFQGYFGKRRGCENMKLTYAHTMGTVDVQMSVPFRGGKYTLIVSTLQAATLHYFHEMSGTVSFGDLETHLNLKIPEVPTEFVMKRILHSLSCGRYKLLKKNPPDGKIHSSDTFAVNGKFFNKNKRLKVPMASFEKARKNRISAVESDRSMNVEAVIVRVMKTRKIISHNNLLAEAMKILNDLHSIEVDPKSLKKSIGKLIDKEYMARVENSLNEYKYVAGTNA